jgi:kynureninase
MRDFSPPVSLEDAIRRDEDDPLREKRGLFHLPENLVYLPGPQRARSSAG